MTDAQQVTEQQIAALVRRFYDKARQDDSLGPLFAKVVHDWEDHFLTVQDFWSHLLLGTDRYKGMPFGVHTHLPIELDHFDRWLALFTETAREELPAQAAELAIGRANHMTKAFRTGLFPWTDADGKPARFAHRAEQN